LQLDVLHRSPAQVTGTQAPPLAWKHGAHSHTSVVLQTELVLVAKQSALTAQVPPKTTL